MKCFAFVDTSRADSFILITMEDMTQAIPSIVPCIKTFMVYLNENFIGGSTRFYNEKQWHYQSGDAENVIYSYKPQTGDALIFNSTMTHDGGEVLDGRKYILRSEIMYSSIDEDDDVDFGPD